MLKTNELPDFQSFDDIENFIQEKIKEELSKYGNTSSKTKGLPRS